MRARQTKQSAENEIRQKKDYGKRNRPNTLSKNKQLLSTRLKAGSRLMSRPHQFYKFFASAATKVSELMWTLLQQLFH
jgi:hypothetical protein